MVEFKLTKSISLLNNTEINVLNLDFDALTMSDLKTSNKIAKMIAVRCTCRMASGWW